MWKISALLNMLLLGILATPAALLAAPDQYPGDTSIYGGVVSAIQPNVLILLDTTGSMDESILASDPYNPGTTYTGTKTANAVYTSSGSFFLSNVDNVTTLCGGVDPRQLLMTTGLYNGRRLTNTGGCRTTGTGSYVTGNYLNYINGPSAVYDTKLNIAKTVIKNLLNSTSGVNFGVIRFDTTHSPTFFTTAVSGLTYTTTIKNMEDIFTGTTTNKAALIQAVTALSSGGATQVGETMFEAMRYFQGGAPAFSTTGIGVTASKYTSPIKASCQKNYMIVVTDGESNSDDSATLKTICTLGDCDGDGKEPGNLNHSADDIAKYLYDTDLSSVYDLKQNVTTFTIGFGDIGSNATAVDLLKRAADSSHGHGQAYLASNQSGLTSSLTQIVANIMEINTSFVAPVVPVSPDNKTSSASRMYLGLFKPLSGTSWAGNLKKYGLDSRRSLVDNSTPPQYATYLDVKNNVTNVPAPDGLDDRTGSSLTLGLSSGSFIPGTTSFWSTASDAGQVEEGGVGGQLLTRTTARSIYTYLGSNNVLTDVSNKFASTNTAITPTTLAVADSVARDKLISYMYGYDAYDDNSNGDTTEKREWILGDILHSKPVVLNYSKYIFNLSNEANCSINKSMIYVGANDGMLHAFKDCDGSELWAFVPPDALPNLQYTRSTNHTTYLDSTVAMYVNDKAAYGNIVSTDGDKAIILFGQRRGGGTNSTPASGFYYALDVTDPATPKFMWKISNATSGFSELAETWSEPKIAKVKTSTGYKMAAIFGGGYDNLNEDSRYGATQTFVGTGAVITSNTGAGTITSTGTSAPLNPKGRGIYIVEIASLIGTAQVPDFTNSGTKIWSYTFADNAAMTSSFASELSLLDTEMSGYINRIYALDTAANLWRFDIGSGNTATWTGKKKFASNPGVDGTIGRKAFYKPTVTLEVGYDMVLFGTGDREHPQNKNVLDRIYGVKVRDADAASTTVQTEATGPGGIGLYDVTTDQLQDVTIANSGTATSPTPGSQDYILKQLKDSNGWYIMLNEQVGEKVLSTPLVYNRQLFLTTYVPQTLPNPDPCQPSNLGYSSIYIVDYLTAAAVQGLDTSNDITGLTTPSAIAAAKSSISDGGNNSSALGGVVSGGGLSAVINEKRSDRKTTGGDGIASSPVFDGEAIVVVAGDEVLKVDVKKGGLVRTLYWRQK